MHWLISPSNERNMRTACRADSSNCTGVAELVTCQACLGTVIRETCNAVSDEPGPLPARCSRLVHETGDHDWVPGSRAQRRADLQRQAVTSATNAAIVPPTVSAASPGDQLPVRKGTVRRIARRSA